MRTLTMVVLMLALATSAAFSATSVKPKPRPKALEYKANNALEDAPCQWVTDSLLSVAEERAQQRIDREAQETGISFRADGVGELLSGYFEGRDVEGGSIGSRLLAIKASLGAFDRITIEGATDVHPFSTEGSREAEERDQASLRRSRRDKAAALVGAQALTVVSDGLHCRCADKAWQAVYVKVWRGTPGAKPQGERVIEHTTTVVEKPIIQRVLNFELWIGPVGEWRHVDVPQFYSSTLTSGITVRKPLEGGWDVSYSYTSGNRNYGKGFAVENGGEIRIRTHQWDLGLPAFGQRDEGSRGARLQVMLGANYSSARHVTKPTKEFFEMARGWSGTVGLRLNGPMHILLPEVWEVGGRLGLGRAEVYDPSQVHIVNGSYVIDAPSQETSKHASMYFTVLF